ncbi:MAG: homoserine dehydrogenase [Phycisphaerae bacterium]|nr:homoserine dehydrogenase [Phycisphaerae bacterium]
MSAQPNSQSCPHNDDVVVLKFGSSVLPNEESLSLAIHEVYRYLRRGQKVIAVVSAMGPTTDKLLAHAKTFGDSCDAGGIAALAATGEAQTQALLTLALDRAGIPANALDPGALGLRTSGPLLDSKPESLNIDAIRAALEDRPVLVVPGFIGRDSLGRTSLLGRGGSDFSALFIAAALGCDCVLVKDVDGLYDRDPSEHASTARRYRKVSYDDVLSLVEGVAQHKAVRFAREHHLSIGIGGIGHPVGTVIGPEASEFAKGVGTPKPVKVALLGLGTVGLGVYRHLAQLPKLFEVVAVGVRTLSKHASSGVPAPLLSSDLNAVLASQADVVVESIGGLHPARELILQAIAAGKHVVTANKAVIAAFGPELHERARKQGVTVRYSASVGGGVPVIEAIRRARESGEVVELRGVLNGTTNFILGRLEKGVAFDEAVREAQAAGFAEADPSADLDGLDVANKLAVLAAVGFGASLPVDKIERTGIRAINVEAVAAAKAQGNAIRLVATLRAEGAGVIRALVRPEEVPLSGTFAQLQNEQNAAIVRLADGRQIVVNGRGAGRWPTAESVFADLLEIAGERFDPQDSHDRVRTHAKAQGVAARFAQGASRESVAAPHGGAPSATPATGVSAPRPGVNR